MVGSIVYQLTRNLSDEDIKTAGFDAYFVNHTAGVYPSSASGVPFSASAIAVKGDTKTSPQSKRRERPMTIFLAFAATTPMCAMP